jgi:hypothetical protein
MRAVDRIGVMTLNVFKVFGFLGGCDDFHDLLLVPCCAYYSLMTMRFSNGKRIYHRNHHKYSSSVTE